MNFVLDCGQYHDLTCISVSSWDTLSMAVIYHRSNLCLPLKLSLFLSVSCDVLLVMTNFVFSCKINKMIKVNNHFKAKFLANYFVNLTSSCI